MQYAGQAGCLRSSPASMKGSLKAAGSRGEERMSISGSKREHKMPQRRCRRRVDCHVQRWPASRLPALLIATPSPHAPTTSTSSRSRAARQTCEQVAGACETPTDHPLVDRPNAAPQLRQPCSVLLRRRRQVFLPRMPEGSQEFLPLLLTRRPMRPKPAEDGRRAGRGDRLHTRSSPTGHPRVASVHQLTVDAKTHGSLQLGWRSRGRG